MPWQALLGPQSRLDATLALDAWHAQLRERAGSATPFQQAVLGGRLAATPGLAFFAGYQAALRALWPSAPDGPGGLCVTEQRRLRPADQHTRLEGLQLRGEKDFVTGGTAAQWLLVSGRDESAGEAAHLSLCVVHVGDPGVTLAPGPQLPLLPDVPHARLRLTDAPCERLAGDGWEDYVKPFRTLEDVHVLAALAAWLYGVSLEQSWPGALSLRLAALLAGLGEAARGPVRAPQTNVLLAGLNATFDALAVDLDRALGDSPHGVAWRRDRAVLALAGEARARRLEKALAACGLDLGLAGPVAAR